MKSLEKIILQKKIEREKGIVEEMYFFFVWEVKESEYSYVMALVMWNKSVMKNGLQPRSLD